MIYAIFLNEGVLGSLGRSIGMAAGILASGVLVSIVDADIRVLSTFFHPRNLGQARVSGDIGA